MKKIFNFAKISIVLCFLVLSIGISHAGVYEDANIKIWAQSVTYNKLRKVVEGTGKVSVKGAHFSLTGSYVKYFPATKKLIAEDQFTMEIEGYRIFGSRLEYNVVTKVGSVMIVRINFGETFLGGSFMKMDESKFDILNAYFTGCNLPTSDYHISSTEIVLYPRTGLVVAYWGIFWLGPVPTLPVPTFVYNAPVPKPPKKEAVVKAPPKLKKKYIKRKRDIFPKPGLGYNTEDGYFLIQPFDYYFGPKSYMRTHLSWAEKKNIGIATAMNYMLWSDIHEGEIRAGTNAEDETFGGLTHIYSFGPRLLSPEEDKKYVYDKYFPGNKYLFEFEVNGSYRERINIYKNIGPFGRVSFLPKGTLRANRNNFINEDFTYFSAVSWATISEESTGVGGQRQKFEVDITYDRDIWLLGHFNAMSEVDMKGYSGMEETIWATYESWNSATQNLSLSQNWWGALETRFGHTHIYMNEGTTPYEFEGYWFSPYDTFNTYAKLNVFFSNLSYDGTYDLPSQDWRRLEYALRLGMHCYDIVASYVLFKDRATGEELTEFNITAELAASRW